MKMWKRNFFGGNVLHLDQGGGYMKRKKKKRLTSEQSSDVVLLVIKEIQPLREVLFIYHRGKNV